MDVVGVLETVAAQFQQGFLHGIEGILLAGQHAVFYQQVNLLRQLALGFKKMTENKQAIAGMVQLGEEFGYMGSDEFARYWRKDYQIYKDMAKLFKK